MSKRLILTALGLLCGLVIVVDMLVASPLLDGTGRVLLEGAIIVGGMAVLAGVWNILVRNGQRLSNKETRGGALITMLCLIGAFAVGILATAAPRIWTYEYILLPLQSTFAATLVLYVMESAFMHFGSKGIQAAVILATSLVLLVLQLPVAASVSPLFASLQRWLYAIPITYGARGILIGTAIGVALSSLRTLAGKNAVAQAEE